MNGLIRLGVRFLEDDGGTTAIEYAIIGSMLSIVILTAVTQIGTSVNSKFQSVAAAFK